MTWIRIVTLGCVGGVLPDVLRIIAARYDGPPNYLRSSFFWFGLVLLVVLGGAATMLVQPKGTIEALAVGFGAPEIITKLLARPGDRGAGTGGSLSANLRSWWAV